MAAAAQDSSHTQDARRKAEHLEIVSGRPVTHTGGTLLDNVHLIPQALPELNPDDIDLSCSFFGRQLAAPMMICSMTGGMEIGGRLNRDLAEVAGRSKIAFAVGSQRVMLRHPEVTADFAVRKHIPDGVLLGNIGASQLKEYDAAKIVGLVEAIEADGLCVHLNPAQELIQPEGIHEFRGLLDAIARLLEKLKGRLLVKECGAGLSPQVLQKLTAIGVPYIDVSGSGGTSWTKVEMYRATSEQLRRLGQTFADWGLPTAFCVYAAGRIVPEDRVIIASGGIANGLDAARAIALGADVIGVARQVLLAYLKDGQQGAQSFVNQMVQEIKVAMLLSGAGDVGALQRVPRIYKGELSQWIAAFESDLEVVDDN
ncbi:MAG: type 2 isopentenyl-diphosphate Delta-isomerase [bacterium]